MTLDLTAIEESIRGGGARFVGGTLSSAKSYVVMVPDTPGGRVFYKKYEPRDSVKDAVQDSPIEDPREFNRVLYTLPATANIDITVSKRTKAVTEVMSTLRWRELGIPSQTLLHYDGDRTMIFRYMKGYSIGEKLNKEEADETEFGKVLDSLHELRKKAKEGVNPEILHSDPYPDNFFYDTERSLVVPSDSSKVNKRSMGFNEVDARLYLFFLSKIFHIETSDEARIAYLNQSADRLTESEKSLIRELYVDPSEQRNYFESQGLPEDNVIDIYYRADVRDAILQALAS